MNSSLPSTEQQTCDTHDLTIKFIVVLTFCAMAVTLTTTAIALAAHSTPTQPIDLPPSLERILLLVIGYLSGVLSKATANAVQNALSPTTKTTVSPTEITTITAPTEHSPIEPTEPTEPTEPQNTSQDASQDGEQI